MWLHPEIRPRVLTSLLAVAIAVAVVPGASAQVGEDYFYRALHPRLFFGASDLPAMRARVHDGGPEDDAYAFIRSQFDNVYASAPFDSLIRNDFAQEQITNIGLAGFFGADVDSFAMRIGRRLTLYIARTYDVDTDAYGSSLRLRALAIGYDLYFAVATPAERLEVQAEAESYLTYMTNNINYDIWMHPPYVSNKTAMVAAALGLGAIAFHDELDAAVVDPALARTDALFGAWRDAQIEGDGAYREGALYACWSLRNLVYYFEARLRFDGTDYTHNTSLVDMADWLVYELDPRGDARLNNIQDLTDYFRPLARHTTYLEWALKHWASPVAAYLWDHAAGAYGRDMGDEADKAATVLWHRSVPVVNPATLLPKSRLWPLRGLYYFRTGWPDGASSDDVVFSFYSGPFQGGHAQEDQNQFTLAAYGEKLVVDHGAGSLAKQSEAHNIVLIDGAGQHNAGASIGTDGRISNYLGGGFADFLTGDATAAYATHSPYNNAGVPYPWSDWSWGDSGSNPVLRAIRRVLVVHGDEDLPYAFIQDDIDKDGTVHHYDWRVHVPESAVVDAGSDPIRIETGAAALDVHVINPTAVTTSVAAFDNGSEDPNSQVLALGADAADPAFGVLLIPRRTTDTAPPVTTTVSAWVTTTFVTWSATREDVIFARTVFADPPPLISLSQTGTPNDPISTDASIGVVQLDGGVLSRYLVAEATSLWSGGVELVHINDGPASVAHEGTLIRIDREDADFRIFAGAATDVYYGTSRVPTIQDGAYLTNAFITPVGDRTPPSVLGAKAFPNPFNPSVTISFRTPVRSYVTVDIHDASGRRVTTLAAGNLPAGGHTLEWDGRNHAGRGVASGIYFARVRAGDAAQTIKLVLLR